MKSRLTRDGYPEVGLSTGGRAICRRVHRLVWEAFRGPIPSNYVINHLNGRKDDNRLSNLECVTNRQNVLHAYRELGRRRPGEKLTAEDVVAMREARANGTKLSVLARRYNVTMACVGHVCTGKTWKHAGGPLTRKKAARAKSKRDKATVHEAVRRHRAGESSATIAREYGVSDVTVLNWSRGRFRTD